MKEFEALIEYDWVLWFVGLFILFELFRWLVTAGEWLIHRFGFETKQMREKREKREAMEQRLQNAENDIQSIKEASNKNIQTFLEIKEAVILELSKIHAKIDAQKETDKAILRDRIASGMRYFSQNLDANGNVHISFSDYENMEALFQEYFSKGGNGAFKRAYETDFKKFIIDHR